MKVVLCRVPRSPDFETDGKVASSSYAENVLGPAMAGGLLHDFLLLHARQPAPMASHKSF